MRLVLIALVSIGVIACDDAPTTPSETASDAPASEAVSVEPPPRFPEPDCRGCVLASLGNEECDQCGRRYVAGLEIPSGTLFELLDAHGHTYNPDTLPCEQCRQAAKTSELCPEHGWGFANDQLYFSKLSYLLAQGTPQRRSQLTCATCGGAEATLWCDRCGQGWVGNVVFRDRSRHQDAVVEYEHLVTCVQTAATCELCAAAQFSGMKCPKCKIEYPRR